MVNFGKACFPFLSFKRKHYSRCFGCNSHQTLLALPTQIHRHGGATTCIFAVLKLTTSKFSVEGKAWFSKQIPSVHIYMSSWRVTDKKPDIKVRVSLNFHYFWLHSGILHYKRTYYIIPRQSSGRLLPPSS